MIFTNPTTQPICPSRSFLKGRGTREHLLRIMPISMYNCTIVQWCLDWGTLLLTWCLVQVRVRTGCVRTRPHCPPLSSILVSARSRSLPGARLRLPASTVDTAPWDSVWTITSCGGLCVNKIQYSFQSLKVRHWIQQMQIPSHPITAREKIREIM